MDRRQRCRGFAAVMVTVLPWASCSAEEPWFKLHSVYISHTKDHDGSMGSSLSASDTRCLMANDVGSAVLSVACNANHGDNQLWKWTCGGFLVNKQTSLCLTVGSKYHSAWDDRKRTIWLRSCYKCGEVQLSKAWGKSGSQLWELDYHPPQISWLKYKPYGDIALLIKPRGLEDACVDVWGTKNEHKLWDHQPVGVWPCTWHQSQMWVATMQSGTHAAFDGDASGVAKCSRPDPPSVLEAKTASAVPCSNCAAAQGFQIAGQTFMSGRCITAHPDGITFDDLTEPVTMDHKVVSKPCRDGELSQKWQYLCNGQIRSLKYPSQCFTAAGGHWKWAREPQKFKTAVGLTPCAKGHIPDSQVWDIKYQAFAFWQTKPMYAIEDLLSGPGIEGSDWTNIKPKALWGLGKPDGTDGTKETWADGTDGGCLDVQGKGDRAPTPKMDSGALATVYWCWPADSVISQHWKPTPHIFNQCYGESSDANGPDQGATSDCSHNADMGIPRPVGVPSPDAAGETSNVDGSTENCSPKWSENCKTTRCCKDAGFKCYLKHEHWASCQSHCHHDGRGMDGEKWNCTDLTNKVDVVAIQSAAPELAGSRNSLWLLIGCSGFMLLSLSLLACRRRHNLQPLAGEMSENETVIE